MLVVAAGSALASTSYSTYYVEGYVYYKDVNGGSHKMTQSEHKKYQVSINSDKSSYPAFVLSSGKYRLTLKLAENDDTRAKLTVSSPFFNTLKTNVSLSSETISKNFFLEKKETDSDDDNGGSNKPIYPQVPVINVPKFNISPSKSNTETENNKVSVYGYIYYKTNSGMHRMTKSEIQKYMVKLTSNKSNAEAWYDNSGKYHLYVTLNSNDERKARVTVTSPFFNTYNSNVDLGSGDDKEFAIVLSKK